MFITLILDRAKKNFLLMLSAGKWPGGDGNDKIKSEQIYVVNSNFNSVSSSMKKYEGNFFYDLKDS